MLKILTGISSVTLLLSCGGTQFVDTAELPNSYQCSYMQDVCKEAREFERTYNAMSPDEKKEFENVMKTYHSQCNDALEICKKSKPTENPTK
jgi:hypothetical protein